MATTDQIASTSYSTENAAQTLPDIRSVMEEPEHKCISTDSQTLIQSMPFTCGPAGFKTQEDMFNPTIYNTYGYLTIEQPPKCFAEGCHSLDARNLDHIYDATSKSCVLEKQLPLVGYKALSQMTLDEVSYFFDDLLSHTVGNTIVLEFHPRQRAPQPSDLLLVIKNMVEAYYKSLVKNEADAKAKAAEEQAKAAAARAEELARKQQLRNSQSEKERTYEVPVKRYASFSDMARDAKTTSNPTVMHTINPKYRLELTRPISPPPTKPIDTAVNELLVGMAETAYQLRSIQTKIEDLETKNTSSMMKITGNPRLDDILLKYAMSADSSGQYLEMPAGFQLPELSECAECAECAECTSVVEEPVITTSKKQTEQTLINLVSAPVTQQAAQPTTQPTAQPINPMNPATYAISEEHKHKLHVTPEARCLAAGVPLIQIPTSVIHELTDVTNTEAYRPIDTVVPGIANQKKIDDLSNSLVGLTDKIKATHADIKIKNSELEKLRLQYIDASNQPKQNQTALDFNVLSKLPEAVREAYLAAHSSTYQSADFIKEQIEKVSSFLSIQKELIEQLNAERNEVQMSLIIEQGKALKFIQANPAYTLSGDEIIQSDRMDLMVKAGLIKFV